MEHVTINTSIEALGWAIVKPHDGFDGQYLSEDLAQYRKAEYVLDFGFYGDCVSASSGEFRVCLIRGADWTAPLATSTTKDRDIALALLVAAARLR